MAPGVCSQCADGWITLPDLSRKRCACRATGKKLSWLAGIPPRFRDATLDTYEPQNERQLDAKVAIETEPLGSYALIGPYGIGKTHLLCAQYKILCERGVPALFRSTREIVDEFMAGDLHVEESELLEFLRQGGRYFHLFWDDADKLKLTDYKADALYHVANKIYANCFGLSFTSNYPLVHAGGLDLREKIGPAVVRRIGDMCKVLEM